MNPDNFPWKSFVLFVAIGIFLWLIPYLIWPEETWIANMIGVIGSIASLGGVILALIQIEQANTQIKAVESVAQATQKAVVENRKEIRDFLSFSDIAHLIETMKSTQHHVLTKDYKSAVVMLQEVKDDMLRANNQFAEYLSLQDIDLPQHIKTINIDIDSLVHHITETEDKGRKSTLKPNEIHRNLETAREIIIRIESSLRKERL